MPGPHRNRPGTTRLTDLNESSTLPLKFKEIVSGKKSMLVKFDGSHGWFSPKTVQSIIDNADDGIFSETEVKEFEKAQTALLKKYKEFDEQFPDWPDIG